MLNCDWFQPFDLSTYSIGVLCLVILNLSRSIRFKPENILIAGIIPAYNSDLNRVDFSEDIETLQTHEQHKKNVLCALFAVTPSQCDETETETGSRFTELMNLLYYDCIRYAVIDPMHNLLLSTPKHLFTK